MAISKFAIGLLPQLRSAASSGAGDAADAIVAGPGHGDASSPADLRERLGDAREPESVLYPGTRVPGYPST
eukprot:3336419-Rhodomonas_salina.1